ncbi:MAG: hypothetical protein ABJ275_11800 [Maricaulaceae bacterium]
MSQDFDKQQWQAQQAARDAALDKDREKHRKARERSARNAQRKLERLRRSLGEAGELSDWEDEFSESVTERLDKYGSAFHDLQKGRPGDALSFAQKRVVAGLNKKVKDQRKAKRAAARGEAGDEETSKYTKKRSSFGSKKKPKFTPRVRQLDEDFEIADTPPPRKAEPFIPTLHRSNSEPVTAVPIASEPKAAKPSGAKRPFLRLVVTEIDEDEEGARKSG